MKPMDMKVLVIGDRCWGIADTLTEAIAKAKRAGGRVQRRYIEYVAHPDTREDQGGYINYPTDHQPKEIHRVGVKK